jgi:hypothetical protein
VVSAANFARVLSCAGTVPGVAGEAVLCAPGEAGLCAAECPGDPGPTATARAITNAIPEAALSDKYRRRTAAETRLRAVNASPDVSAAPETTDRQVGDSMTEGAFRQDFFHIRQAQKRLRSRWRQIDANPAVNLPHVITKRHEKVNRDTLSRAPQSPCC